MTRRLEDLRSNHVAASAADAKPSTGRPRLSLSVLLATLLLAFSLPASADSNESPFELLSESLRYSPDDELRPPSCSYRRNEGGRSS